MSAQLLAGHEINVHDLHFTEEGMEAWGDFVTSLKSPCLGDWEMDLSADVE